MGVGDTPSRLCVYYGVIVLLVAVSSVCGQPAGFQPISAVGNNAKAPLNVVVNTPYARLLEDSAFVDGISVPGSTASSARLVSNMVFAERESEQLSSNGLNTLHMTYGQFVAHDLMRAGVQGDPEQTEGETGGEDFSIAIPRGDPEFDPFGTGTQTMPFRRSSVAEGTGVTSPRSPPNRVTSVLDCSSLYGSSPEVTEILRNETHRHLMKVSYGPKGEELLPRIADAPVPIDNDAKIFPDSALFACGDMRCNENVLLTAMHTLWVREHNRIARGLIKLYPRANPEELFWQARRRVIAFHQAIVFNEFVATTIGGPLPEYEGYNDDINPQTTVEFDTLAFRYGHSEIVTTVNLATNDRVIFDSLLLRHAYSNPTPILQHGIEPLLMGGSVQVQKRVDTFYVEDIRSMLFGPPGSGGLDLAAFTIQRTRDHGAPLYNDLRQRMGLSRHQSFDQVTTDRDLADRLAALYQDPDNCEAFACGLAEDHEGASNVGPLFAAIIKDQFLNLREGDAWYYKNKAVSGFSDDEIDFIDPTTFTDLLLRNTDITEFQCAGFFASSGDDCQKEVALENELPLLTNVAELLNGDVILSWKIVDDLIQFNVEAATDGWVGIGFASNPGNMVDADAVIGIAVGDSASVSDYYITDRQEGCPGVCPDNEQGGDNDVTNVSGFESGGRTFFSFTRPLDSGDSRDVAIEQGTTPIVVAYGSSKTLGYHGGNKGAAEINFFTGEVTITSVDDDMDGPEWDRLTVHGVLMFVAWTVLFPMGIIVVRFCKKFLVRWWFRLHMLIQYLAVLLIIIALILAVEAVASLRHDHIANTHAILGIVSVSLAILTPAVGQITSIMWSSNRKGIPIFPDRVHYLLGYLSPIVAIVTIYFGLDERGSAWWWYLLASIWIAIITIGFWVAYFLQLTYVTVQKQKNKGLAEAPNPSVESAEEHWSSEEEDDA